MKFTFKAVVVKWVLTYVLAVDNLYAVDFSVVPHNLNL